MKLFGIRYNYCNDKYVKRHDKTFDFTLVASGHICNDNRSVKQICVATLAYMRNRGTQMQQQNRTIRAGAHLSVNWRSCTTVITIITGKSTIHATVTFYLWGL